MEGFFITEGNREKKAIVFIHGGGSSGLMWKKQIEFFKEDYYCIVPDLKGNGTRYNEPYISIEDCANEIVEMIKKEKPGETIHLVGTSFGAAVATEVLNIDPDLIDHACINSCNVDNHPIMKFLSIASIKPLLKTSLDKFKRMYRKFNIPENFLEQLYKDMNAMSLDNWQRLLGSTFDYRIKKSICNVTTPVLVFLGTKETGMAIKSMKRLTNSLPNSRGILVEDETHAFCYQNPDLFNKIVEAWITGKSIPGDIRELG